MDSSTGPPGLDPGSPMAIGTAALARLGFDLAQLGIVIVDHGSRRAESNEMLVEFARRFAQASGLSIVEPAHMELAEPSIATAFANAVRAGASTVVVFPYFLAPGRHWTEDIPRLVGEAARQHPQVRYLVTAPLGLHPLMLQIVGDRILRCLMHCRQQSPPCDVCEHGEPCHLAEPSDRRRGITE